MNTLVRLFDVVKIHNFALLTLGAALCFLILGFTRLAHGEDWKTSDGKTYRDVKVVKVEEDAVTILCSDGGARIALATLTTDLQQKFHYDPVKAQAAAARYLATQKVSEQELVAERTQAQVQQHQQEAKAQQARVEQENEQAANAALEKIKTVATSGAVSIMGKVVSVIPLDKAGNNAYLIDQLKVDQITGNLAPSGQMVMVAGGVENTFVDGDTLSSGSTQVGHPVSATNPTGSIMRANLWYYAGTTQYTSVMGARVTCRIYSPSLEWALRNLSDQSK